MVQFREGYYADIRIEDRSRTIISYKAGILEDPMVRRFEMNKDTINSFADCSVRDITIKNQGACE